MFAHHGLVQDCAKDRGHCAPSDYNNSLQPYDYSSSNYKLAFFGTGMNSHFQSQYPTILYEFRR